MTRRLLPVLVALPLTAALAACGGPPAPAPTSAAGSSTSTTSTSLTTTTTSTTVPTTSTTTKPKAKPRPKPTTPRTSARTTKPAVKPRPKPPAPKPAVATCRVSSGVSATQVVLVKASGASATIRACRRSGGRYVVDLGPYYGHVGKNGVSWSKREGDLRTPAGTFPLRGGFGVNGNPGLRTGSWFRVDSSDVWVDDSGSSLYNSHQHKPANGRWDSAESLLQTPAYNYAQVIGYNETRTPGKGSAIFFHVDLGHGTAGCVSLPTSALLAVMRWERVGAVMSIS
jgi:L,D-peptidoglycan transpeptidase YkuD (ErfK/YbiS/YcfS/YnhG family)